MNENLYKLISQNNYSKPWKDSYPISFFGGKNKNLANLVSIYNFMQESAENHIDALGFGVDVLKQNSHAWILSKLALKIIDFPICKTQLNIKTWMSRITKVHAFRDFIITDVNNHKIAEAKSSWLCIDFKKKMLVNPGLYVSDIVLNTKEKTKRVEISEIRKLYNFDYFNKIIIQNSSPDINGYVNKVNYIQWLLGYIRLNFFNENMIQEIEINFLSESLCNDEIEIRSKLLEDCFSIYHSIYNKTSGKEICCAITKWKNIN